MQGKRNIAFDILKAVCCFFVVLRHAEPVYRDYTLPIASSAVACFFMISGFFLYSTDPSVYTARIKRATIRAAKYAVYGTLIYIPIGLIVAHSAHDYSAFSLMALRNFIICNEVAICVPLWYLYAYLYTLIILRITVKVNLHIMYLLIPVLLTANLLVGRYAFGLFGGPLHPMFARNFLLTGLPCVLIGMFIKECLSNQRFKAVSARFWLYSLILLMVCVVAEHRILLAYDLKGTEDSFAFSILIAAAMVLLANKTEIYREGRLSTLGQRYSIHIYILHPIMMAAAGFVALKLLPVWFGDNVYRWISPIVIFGLTYCLCIILDRYKLLPMSKDAK